MHKFLFALSVLILFGAPGFSEEDPNSHIDTVLVSVAPYKFFVEKIAGDTVNVLLMVPAGASAHTYEPTPKQMIKASRADLWFTIGESFEDRVIKAIQNYNPNLITVDLRKGVKLISSNDKDSSHHCSNPNCQDLHIWLSPRQSKIQAQHIADALGALYPQHEVQYQTSLKAFLQELDALDLDIQKILKPLQNRVILVSHPAYAYFCRDYDLKQLSIEFEGKDPMPQQLTKLLNTVRKDHIKTVFIQPQYSGKGARLIAEKIGANIVTLDPYSEDYLNSMRQIAKSFAEGK